LASTSEIYGDPLEHPKKKLTGARRSNRWRSVYDEAKRFAEALTMAYYRYHNLDTHIVRILIPLAPVCVWMMVGSVPNFIKQALKGEPYRLWRRFTNAQFLYVDDLIDGIDRLMKSDEHFPVNIGNPMRSASLILPG